MTDERRPPLPPGVGYDGWDSTRGMGGRRFDVEMGRAAVSLEEEKQAARLAKDDAE